MNKTVRKWMDADLYEKCLSCDGEGSLLNTFGEPSPCPECDGVGFMLVGATIAELEELKAKAAKMESTSRERDQLREENGQLADQWEQMCKERDDAIRDRAGNPPWIPVIGDRVQARRSKVEGTIDRVFRGYFATGKNDRISLDVAFDNGGYARNFGLDEFEPI